MTLASLTPGSAPACFSTLAAQDALFGGDWRKTPRFAAMRLDAVTGALEGEPLISLIMDAAGAHYLDAMR